jgi:hypothetical protein
VLHRQSTASLSAGGILHSLQSLLRPNLATPSNGRNAPLPAASGSPPMSHRAGPPHGPAPAFPGRRAAPHPTPAAPSWAVPHQPHLVQIFAKWAHLNPRNRKHPFSAVPAPPKWHSRWPSCIPALPTMPRSILNGQTQQPNFLSVHFISRPITTFSIHPALPAQPFRRPWRTHSAELDPKEIGTVAAGDNKRRGRFSYK